MRLLQTTLSGEPGASFQNLIELIRKTDFGQTALLDSRSAWIETLKIYNEILPNGSLIDFFWTWRFLARSLLAVISTPLPDVGVFHAVSTGYAGLVGAYAQHVTHRPLIVTEHGIYTNERRIELSVASWIFDPGSDGFALDNKAPQIRDVWMTAFISLSKISYASADIITTQYPGNQDYQRSDGAPDNKLRIIPNGIDIDLYARVRRSEAPRPPTVLMIGRIVPIKDIRTFIVSMSLLKEIIPDVVAILIGPEEEDPAYAASCRAMVTQLGLESTMLFLGRVPDVAEYLGQADVIALTSISESQPIALLEAAATGLPAVTTDVGSCREILEGFDGDPVIGRGGIVVDACNPKATAEALSTILRDERLRANMGKVMKNRIQNFYNKDRVRQLYEDLYAEAKRNNPIGKERPAIEEVAPVRATIGKAWRRWCRGGGLFDSPAAVAAIWPILSAAYRSRRLQRCPPSISESNG